jgi:hypothetical protein
VTAWDDRKILTKAPGPANTGSVLICLMLDHQATPDMPVPLARIDNIWIDAGTARADMALVRAADALADLRDAGIRAGVTGSLAGEHFSAFSDVDFAIAGSREEWSRAVTIIERAMGDMPVDVICLSDLAPDEARFIMEGSVDEAGLRARRTRSQTA